jgi:hypothetical protein
MTKLIFCHFCNKKMILKIEININHVKKRIRTILHNQL